MNKFTDNFNIRKAHIDSMLGRDDIEKGKGEGSRGGKVIRHTKSGKPIYEDHNHSGIDTSKLQYNTPDRNVSSKLSKLKDEEIEDFRKHHKDLEKKHDEGQEGLHKKTRGVDGRNDSSKLSPQEKEKLSFHRSESLKHAQATEQAKQVMKNRKDKFLRDKGAKKIRPNYDFSGEANGHDRSDAYEHEGKVRGRDELYEELKGK